jgi:exopolysaccharide biosynthesis polyprenyl glycosylphosphotransferase
MHNTRRKLLMNAYVLGDLSLMVMGVIFSSFVVLPHPRAVSISELFAVRVRLQNVVIFLGALLCWYLIFNLCGLYASRRLANRNSELFDVLKGTSLGMLMLFVIAIAFEFPILTPRFIVLFWMITTIATISSRTLMRLSLAFFRRHGRNLRDVVIAGTNSRALELAEWLKSHPELGYRIVGFVDQDWHGIDRLSMSGHTLVSDIQGFQNFLRTNVVDEVMIALPYRSMYEHATRIAAVCEEQGIMVRGLTPLFDWKSRNVFDEDFENDVLTKNGMMVMRGWPVLVKRLLDIALSLAALIACSPILLAAAALIKLSSPGSIFFIQRRLGFNKHPFGVYKFRTMVADAEARMGDLEHRNEVSGPVFKMWNDPRITPVGRVLRRTSIDELPQLFNVLKGEMSLVGPRPLPIRDCQGFDADWQRRRFSVKPGITCLWQIGGRSATPFQKWMELDLQYIERWSLWLDLKILVQTIPAVMRGTGAA